MFELLPGAGVVLPYGAGMLRFGMPERSARRALGVLRDVRETWICRTAWSFFGWYAGVGVAAWGDEDDGGLCRVVLERAEPRPVRPAGVPVVWDGIDLFGYPADEVHRATGGSSVPAPGLHVVRSAAPYLTEVSLKPSRRTP